MLFNNVFNYNVMKETGEIKRIVKRLELEGLIGGDAIINLCGDIEAKVKKLTNYSLQLEANTIPVKTVKDAVAKLEKDTMYMQQGYEKDYADGWNMALELLQESLIPEKP